MKERLFVTQPQETRHRECGEYSLNEADIIDQHVDILYEEKHQSDNALETEIVV